MLRKIVISLAAAALVTGASTLSASAGHSGGGSGMQGGGGPGMGMHGGGGSGMQRGTFGGSHFGGGGPRVYGFHGDRHGYGERFEHRPYYGYGYRERYEHRPYYRDRYYRYGGYGGGSCWSRVWTPDGWSRRWVCGYERPSYGHRYGSERPSYGHRYGRH